MAITTTTPAPAPAAPAEATPLTGLQVALNGMTASASAIAAAVASAKKDDASTQRVRANVMHLEHMLSTDLIKDSKSDTKAFTDAVEAGKKFLV